MGKNGMKIRREIHSLDYAVCVAVSLLDRIFRGRCKRWDISHGLDLEIIDRQQGYPDGDVLVTIHPVGWEEGERIVLQCARFGREWEVLEGTVFSERLPKQLERRFSFKFNVWHFPLPHHCIESRDTLAEKFLATVKA